MGERCVLGAPEIEAEADVHEPVGSVRRQHDPELVDDPPGCGGVQLHSYPLEVGGDPLVPQDRYGVAGTLDRRRSRDVMEMAVDDGDDRCGRRGANRVQRPAHLLDGLTTVDGDEAVGTLDEVLVGKAVADHRPHAVADADDTTLEPNTVSKVRRVGELTSCAFFHYRGVVGEAVRNRVAWHPVILPAAAGRLARSQPGSQGPPMTHARSPDMARSIDLAV